MKVPKPTEHDKERFREFAPDDLGVEVKPMFGNLAAFINNNMFMGLFGSQIGLRLPDDRRMALLAEDGAGTFGPPERPMSEYASLPTTWSIEQAAPWIDDSFEYTAQLPPKVKKPRKKTSKKPTKKAASR